jgi:hypothetical protein
LPYRTENFRILPVFGAGAVQVSPRATLDDLPWRWVDTSDAHTIVVAGLPSGPHKVRIELANPFTWCSRRIGSVAPIGPDAPAPAGAAPPGLAVVCERLARGRCAS